MLAEFVTCEDCQCYDCDRNYSCPKTDLLNNPCIDCCGIPPYAPFDIDERDLYKFKCEIINDK